MDNELTTKEIKELRDLVIEALNLRMLNRSECQKIALVLYECVERQLREEKC